MHVCVENTTTHAACMHSRECMLACAHAVVCSCVLHTDAFPMQEDMLPGNPVLGIPEDMLSVGECCSV